MEKTIFDTDILIVDDNAELRSMLETFFRREGFSALSFAADCKSAGEQMRKQCPEFVILDVNLPDGDGFSLMKGMKEEAAFRRIPVLFLSARDRDADRLTGLGLGADDYMVKPFLPKELLLRMTAILRRSYPERLSVKQAEGSGIAGKEGRRETGFSEGASAAAGTAAWDRTGMEYGYFSGEEQKPERLTLGARIVDFEAGTVRSGEREEKLTFKELKILETLARSRGKIVTFDSLCKAVWNAQYYTYENTVMVHIRRLREKIEDDPGKPKWLVTARGIGYKLNAAEPQA